LSSFGPDIKRRRRERKREGREDVSDTLSVFGLHIKRENEERKREAQQ